MTWLPLYNDDDLQFVGVKISKTTLGFEMFNEPKRKMIKDMKVEEVKNVALKRHERWRNARQQPKVKKASILYMFTRTFN